MKTIYAVPRIVAAMLLLPAVALAPVGADEVDRYWLGLDIPLPAGMTEDEDARLVFDKPAGRIVESAACGTPGAAATLLYYRDTMGALGWIQVSAGAREIDFARDGERLTIRLEEAACGLSLTLSLRPDTQ